MKQLFTDETANGSSGAFYHTGGLLNVYIDAAAVVFGTVKINAVYPNAAENPIAGGEELTTEGMHVIDAAPFIGKAELADTASVNVNVWVESETEAYARVLKAAQDAA